MLLIDVLVTSTLIGLAYDFIDVTDAIHMGAAGVKTFVFISILRLHRWWCPIHNRRHPLAFWSNGQDPFHTLYFFDHVLRYHLHDADDQSDWEFDPFGREHVRKTLPGIWLPRVKITRWKNSLLSQASHKKWDIKALRMG